MPPLGGGMENIMKKYLLPESGNFYKANLHCHTNVSDGNWSPEKVKEEYIKQGYSIVAYTDHNIMLPHGDLTDDSFLALTGYEINISVSRDANGNTPGGYKTCHICLIAPTEKDTDQVCVHRTKYLNLGSNQPELLETKVKYDRNEPDFERVYTPECISECMAKGQEKGYFVTYNHPTWSQESYPQYMAYEGMDAMEICNYGCLEAGWQEYNPRVYDDMLRGGKRIYCIATDDNHNGRADSFGGFTVIKAEKLDYPTVFKALKDGHFYASQGPAINELYVEGDTVTVKCSAAKEIRLNTGVIRASIKKANNGELLTEATFKLQPGDIYFRITVVDEKGFPADTNAYFLDEWVEF